MEDKQAAVIFDIDGTLAHRVNRSPYDWERVGEDTLDQAVAEILRMYDKANYRIIIFTGRDGICEKETKDWLKQHGITWDHFDIRPAGNNERDSIIKRRMYEKIKDRYDVIAVFDDRNQVVEMWRYLGLKCFQVAEGDF